MYQKHRGQLFEEVRALVQAHSYDEALNRPRELKWPNLEHERDVHLYSVSKDWERAQVGRETLKSRRLRTQCLKIVAQHCPEDILYQRVVSEEEWQIPALMRQLRIFRRQTLIDRLVDYWAETEQIHRLRNYLSAASESVLEKHLPTVEPWMKVWQLTKMVKRHPLLAIKWILAKIDDPNGDEVRVVASFNETILQLIRVRPHSETSTLILKMEAYTDRKNITWKAYSRQSTVENFHRVLDTGKNAYSALYEMGKREIRRCKKEVIYKAVETFCDSPKDLRQLAQMALGSYKLPRLAEMLWDTYGRDKLVPNNELLDIYAIDHIPVKYRAEEARNTAKSYGVRIHEPHIPQYSALLPYEEAWVNLRELLMNSEAEVRAIAWTTWGKLVIQSKDINLVRAFVQRAIEAKHDLAMVRRCIISKLEQVPGSIWEEEDAEGLREIIKHTLTAVDSDHETLGCVRSLLTSLSWFHCHWCVDFGEAIMEKVNFHPLAHCKLPPKPEEFNERSVEAIKKLMETFYDPAKPPRPTEAGVRTEKIDPMESFPWTFLQAPQIGPFFFRQWLSVDRVGELNPTQLRKLLAICHKHHTPLFEELLPNVVADRHWLLTERYILKNRYANDPQLVLAVIKSQEMNPVDLEKENYFTRGQICIVGHFWSEVSFLAQTLEWQEAMLAAIANHTWTYRKLHDARLTRFLLNSAPAAAVGLKTELSKKGTNVLYPRGEIRNWRRLTFSWLNRMDDFDAVRHIARNMICETMSTDIPAIKPALLRVCKKMADDFIEAEFDCATIRNVIQNSMVVERSPWTHRDELVELAITDSYKRRGAVSLLRSFYATPSVAATLLGLKTDTLSIRSEINMYRWPMPRAEREIWWNKIMARLDEDESFWVAHRRFAWQKLIKVKDHEEYMAEFVGRYLKYKQGGLFPEISNHYWAEALLNPISFGKGLTENLMLKVVNYEMHCSARNSRWWTKGFEVNVYKTCDRLLNNIRYCKYRASRKPLSWLIPYIHRHRVLKWLAPNMIQASEGEEQQELLHTFCRNVKEDPGLMRVFRAHNGWNNPLSDVPGWKTAFRDSEVSLLQFLANRPEIKA